MILFESIIDGIRDIKDHFGRTMLQLLGVILGAGSIVATFSLSVTGKSQSMEYYKVSGGIQKIWISNKPTGNLDTKTGSDIINIFEELAAANQTIVLVTHDPAIAARTQRRIKIVDGAIVEGDTLDEEA